MFFDAHADILTDMYKQKKLGNNDSFRKRHLEEYRKSGITHSIFVNWTPPQTDNPSLFNEIWENAFDEMTLNKDIFKVCLDTKDMEKSLNEDKIGVILGMEGIMQLDGVSQLRELYEKGVRHASLTWNEVNKYAAGLSGDTEGLTDLGKDVLQEMEKLGMVIDLAHASPRTFQEIYDYTKGPLIISHGNTKALCDHRRNYTDEQLQLIKDRNGVIGICGIGPFIALEKEEWTVKNMARHIDYAVNLIGIDHVGIGLDICYYLGDEVDSNKVEGLLQIGDAPNIFKELEEMGYSEEDIAKIKYKNFFRVIKEVLG